MDDSILTLLFYVGIIIIVFVSKYFSRGLKNTKSNPIVSFIKDDVIGETDINDDFIEHDYSQDRISEGDSNFSFLDSSNHFEEGVSVFSKSFNVENQPIDNEIHIVSDSDLQISLPYLTNFDVRAAIIYSEILKRPEY